MAQKSARFRDRYEAGRHLALALQGLSVIDDVIVYGLPRGGVPPAFQVALALDAPLDVVVVRKLGVPGRPELAMGAVASGGVTILNSELISSLGVSDRDVETIAQAQRSEVQARLERFGVNEDSPDPEGATVVIVDDGMATGSTVRASVSALRQRSPDQVIVAVPIASKRACSEIGGVADRVVCLSTPEPFIAVGAWYDDFEQVPDDEVVRLIESARNHTERKGK